LDSCEEKGNPHPTIRENESGNSKRKKSDEMLRTSLTVGEEKKEREKGKRTSPPVWREQKPPDTLAKKKKGVF